MVTLFSLLPWVYHSHAIHLNLISGSMTWDLHHKHDNLLGQGLLLKFDFWKSLILDWQAHSPYTWCSLLQGIAFHSEKENWSCLLTFRWFVLKGSQMHVLLKPSNPSSFFAPNSKSLRKCVHPSPSSPFCFSQIPYLYILHLLCHSHQLDTVLNKTELTIYHQQWHREKSLGTCAEAARLMNVSLAWHHDLWLMIWSYCKCLLEDPSGLGSFVSLLNPPTSYW